jgi:DNA-binding response OmpR family regulator
MQQNAPLIMQIEDEENIRKLMSVNLVQRGYRAVEAHNGEDGLEQIRAQTPDLLILNIRLPDMSGLDVLDHLDDNSPPYPDFPVIIITASLLDTEAITTHHPRVKKIFTKPFDIKDVVHFIQEEVPNE